MAALLRVRRFGEFLLAVYVIAFAEIVGLTLALSLFGALTRASLLGAAAVVFAIAASLWLLAGSPRPPAPPAGALRGLGAPLLALAAVATVALGYVTALVTGTAPNGWDQQAYHLTRVAFWLQSERVGYIEHAYDERLNFNPVHGELALAFVLGVTREEVLTGLVQVFAAVACALGIFALARRVGLDRREALFGALLFLTLPVVLLQAATTKNDLVVCAFLLAAAVFVLGDTRAEVGLAGLATALAVGTKFTGVYGVVLVLALALLARPRERAAPARGRGRSRSARRLVLVRRERGRDGRRARRHRGVREPELDPRPRDEPDGRVRALARGLRPLGRGGQGHPALRRRLARRRRSDRLARPTPRLPLGPRRRCCRRLAAPAPLAARRDRETGLYKVHQMLGQPPAFLPFENQQAWSPATASAGDSWYGPVGLLLALGVGVAAVVLVRRRRLPGIALLLAAAPVVWLLLVAATLTYHPFQGRFFAFPVALSAALWGIVLRTRPLAWATVALAATTALLVLVHAVEKPSGIRLLDGPRARARRGRWSAGSSSRTTPTSSARSTASSTRRCRADDPVALALTTDTWGYHVFGSELERRVELVPFGSDASDVQARWLLAGYKRVGEIGARCWRRALSTEQGGSSGA